jgi:N-acetylglucosamine-6-phosphate deacetylase
MDQGLRNMYHITGASLIDLAKISSRNAAKALHFDDRGVIAVGNLADIVLLDNTLHVVATYKEGKKVK